MLQGGTRISAKEGWFAFEMRPVDKARRFVPSGVLSRQNEKRRTVESGPVVRMYQCPEGACAGNNSCNDNRTGLLCGYCAPGYALELNTCRKCSAVDNGNSTNLLLAFGILIVLLVLFLNGWREVLVDNYVHMAYDKLSEVLLLVMERFSSLLDRWGQAKDVKAQTEDFKHSVQAVVTVDKKAASLFRDPGLLKILAQGGKIAIGLDVCPALSCRNSVYCP